MFTFKYPSILFPIEVDSPTAVILTPFISKRQTDTHTRGLFKKYFAARAELIKTPLQCLLTTNERKWKSNCHQNDEK